MLEVPVLQHAMARNEDHSIHVNDDVYGHTEDITEPFISTKHEADDKDRQYPVAQSRNVDYFIRSELREIPLDVDHFEEDCTSSSTTDPCHGASSMNRYFTPHGERLAKQSPLPRGSVTVTSKSPARIHSSSSASILHSPRSKICRISPRSLTSRTSPEDPISPLSQTSQTSTNVSGPSCSSTPFKLEEFKRMSRSHTRKSLMSIFSNTTLACRICYEGGNIEELISPCKCAGTMGLMHRSCIEKWLGSSNTNKCEICNFEYITERQPKPFFDWLRRPTYMTDQRNMLGDLVCFLLLTPLAAVSSWLCVTGALYYGPLSGRWESVGLLCLTVFLLIVYCVWCTIACRYHIRVWLLWRKTNHSVKVVDYQPNNTRACLEDSINQNNTVRDLNESHLSPSARQPIRLSHSIHVGSFFDDVTSHVSPVRDLSGNCSYSMRSQHSLSREPGRCFSDTMVVMQLNHNDIYDGHNNTVDRETAL